MKFWNWIKKVLHLPCCEKCNKWMNTADVICGGDYCVSCNVKRLIKELEE